ncbi:HD-GYP domain-containing protein [Pseudodesulfovibrio tunisiensis]|uniref:HD-GYP domain-containing protein n=1 Tax=Pseudodesulfovibrio tunisiensis TaxID=463192 RepID=UPI001FB23582|nr:HD domain-containing phosphohydrolase [Pseudodesulfovibrio tunisiensis]
MRTSLLDISDAVSGALDLLSTTVSGHHRRVGALAAAMGNAMQLGREDVTDLMVAGLLHDVGAFTLDTDLAALYFDINLTDHARIGHMLLSGHPILARPAEIVLYHHTPWPRLAKAFPDQCDGPPFLGNLLSLADRVDVLYQRDESGNSQSDRIRAIISGHRRDLFALPAVEAFLDMSASPDFWAPFNRPPSETLDMIRATVSDREIPDSQLLEFSSIFSHVIDFRSRHTATHSRGVAECAGCLARLAGMSAREQDRIRLAGNLHDIGKLTVPLRLLDKPGALEPDEYETVKRHVSVSMDVLSEIPGFDDVAAWAGQHHERLDGRGYPLGLSGDQLSLGSRIMAVADVFTAITEDRPYRPGMDRDAALGVLCAMARDNQLDARIVGLLKLNYDIIDQTRSQTQQEALRRFHHFDAQL